MQVAEITPSAFRVADGTPLMGRVLMEADERPACAFGRGDRLRRLADAVRERPRCARQERAARDGTRDRRRRDARGFRVSDRARCVDASAHRQRRACAAVRAGDLRVRPARARRDPRHGAGGADGGRAASRERAARHPRAAAAACRAVRDAGRGPLARRRARHLRVDLFLRRDAPRPDLQQRRAAALRARRDARERARRAHGAGRQPQPDRGADVCGGARPRRRGRGHGSRGRPYRAEQLGTALPRNESRPPPLLVRREPLARNGAVRARAHRARLRDRRRDARAQGDAPYGIPAEAGHGRGRRTAVRRRLDGR